MSRAFAFAALLSLPCLFFFVHWRSTSGLGEEVERHRRESALLAAQILDKADEIARLKTSIADLRARNDATDSAASQLRAQLAAHRQTKPDVRPPEDEADAVADFNELYNSAPIVSADGYAISAPVFTQFVFDAKQGVKLVPWLQEENLHLTRLADTLEKSVGEKDGIIAAMDNEIAAHDQRFAFSEERYALAQGMNAALEKRLKAQKRQKIMWAAGALVVGYVVGR